MNQAAAENTTTALRVRMEAAVERLLAALDALDAAGEDLEPQGDEEEAVDDRPCDEIGQDMEPDAEAEASARSEWACGFGPWHDHYSQESGARGTHLALAD